MRLVLNGIVPAAGGVIDDELGEYSGDRWCVVVGDDLGILCHCFPVLY